MWAAVNWWTFVDGGDGWCYFPPDNFRTTRHRDTPGQLIYSPFQGLERLC